MAWVKLSRNRKSRPICDLVAVVRASVQSLNLSRGSRLLVGVSGGADSTALACAVTEASATEGWQPVLAHLHHGLRGKAADADRMFVRRLARQIGARCVTARVSVKELARRGGLSIEMAARVARRRFLVAQARRWNAVAILLGHTMDDQAETVLMRLIRGAATRGMGGMAPKGLLGTIPVIRPWLEIARSDIQSWLRARGQSWCEDESNRDLSFVRNRIRHLILPRLERLLNPHAKEAIARVAQRLREDEEALSEMAQRVLARCAAGPRGWRLAPLSRQPDAIRRRALREILMRAGFPPEKLEVKHIQLLDALWRLKSGSVVLGEGMWAVRDGEFLRFMAEDAHNHAWRFRVCQPVPGEAILPGMRATAVFARGYDRKRSRGIGGLPDTAWLDRNKAVSTRLYWRTWRSGDRILPFGIKGSRKLQDIFTDAHAPRSVRLSLPILVCGREIVWVPGYRIARSWAVRSPRSPSVRVEITKMTRHEVFGEVLCPKGNK